MASAVLNNMSLVLATSIANVTHDSEMSDEATQILFGVLDGLMEEKSQVMKYIVIWLFHGIFFSRCSVTIR